MRLKSFLILSILTLGLFLFLVACAHDKIPIQRLTVLDIHNQEGMIYPIINHETLSVGGLQKRVPLIELQGYVCLDPQTYIEFKHWYQRRRHEAQNQSSYMY